MKQIIGVLLLLTTLYGDPVYNRIGWGVGVNEECKMSSTNCQLSLDTKYGWCDLIYDSSTNQKLRETGDRYSCKIHHSGSDISITHFSDNSDAITKADTIRLIHKAILSIKKPTKPKVIKIPINPTIAYTNIDIEGIRMSKEVTGRYIVELMSFDGGCSIYWEEGKIWTKDCEETDTHIIVQFHGIRSKIRKVVLYFAIDNLIKTQKDLL